MIQYVNPAFEEMTGYPRAEAVGQTPRILKSGEHGEQFYSQLWETITNGEIWRNELVNERKSGEQYVVDQTIAPVTDETGEITNFVAINVDITDRYTSERQLERQNEHLDEFSSILSHDIKNLLNVANGHTELAKETGDDYHLDQVENAHARMEELAEELLVLAQAGKLVEEPEPVSLASIVAEAWSTTASHEATVEMVDPEVVLHADRGRLKQVFENLFHNAIVHAGVDVSIHVGVDGHCLYIEDDGAGIPLAEWNTSSRRAIPRRREWTRLIHRETDYRRSRLDDRRRGE